MLSSEYTLSQILQTRPSASILNFNKKLKEGHCENARDSLDNTYSCKTHRFYFSFNHIKGSVHKK